MTNPALTKLAERLAKATPEELTGFAERLAKRAEHITKIKEHLDKGKEHHEKLMDGLADLKDKADEQEAASKAADATALQKAAGDGVKDLYAGLKTAAEGIGEAHEGISGAIDEYESEASDVVDAGIAASMKHPDFGTQKMVKNLQRELSSLGKRMEKVQKAADERLESVVSGLLSGLEKAARPASTTAPPTLSRMAFTLEKSADGTGTSQAVKVAVPGGETITVASSVSPVLSDGVTPNPEFTKLAESQGDACQKALHSAKPQSGNPFVGIEELVSKRA